MGLREDIQALDDLPTREVFVKPWNKNLRVCTLIGAERDKLESDWLARKKKLNRGDKELTDFRAFVAAWCVVDENGRRVFNPNTDTDWLTKKSGAALCQIWDVAAELNRLTDSDVEELVGNSETGPSAGSTSASP